MNQDRITTTTEYFRVNFNFYEPYEIILDGNFIKLLVERNPPFVKKLQQILHGKVFCKVTDCILSQLQVLGQQFRFVLAEAKKQQVVRCRHPFGMSPKQCIEDLIGSDNPKKYMVCSQDIELRRNIRQLMNVPIFYFGPDQRITMQDINKRNKEMLVQQIKTKLLPRQHETEQIKQYKEEKSKEQKQKQRKEMLKWASVQGLKLPGKKARAPNPLSIKKKKRREEHHKKPDAERTKRIRKRKPKTTFTKSN